MAEYDSVIPPGGQGKLKAKVHTKPTQSGRLVKSITVRTDAPGAESLALSLSLEVYTPIDIKPRPQVYLNAMVGETTSSRVLLARTDRKPLEVTVSPPEVEGLTVTTTKVTASEEGKEGFKAEPGDVWVEVSVANPAKPGGSTSKIVIKTNHPDMEEVVLPITVRTRALIEARPGEIRMFVDEAAESRGNQTMLFRLGHNKGEDFALKSFTSSAPELLTVVADTEGKSRTHQLRVTLEESADLSFVALPFNATITVATDNPRVPEITVPVTLVPRPVRGGLGASPPIRPQLQAPVRPTRTPGVG